MAYSLEDCDSVSFGRVLLVRRIVTEGRAGGLSFLMVYSLEDCDSVSLGRVLLDRRIDTKGTAGFFLRGCNTRKEFKSMSIPKIS